MKKHNFTYLVKSDLYRQNGRISLALFLKDLTFRKGFKFVFWMRAAKHFDKIPIIRLIPKLIFSYYKRVYTSDINYRAEIGPGFSMYHVFGTTFGSAVKIGSNVTVVHGVTIAGKNNKYPKINDNVYVGAGACILGDVTIGSHAIIGANTVVTKDIPDYAVVVGNPFRIVSYEGSASALVNTWNLKNV